MPTLVATAGATNANSYCTLAEANTYHESRLYTTSWTDAEDDNKVIALIWATRMLDEICDWVGEKSTGEQALRWPRWDAWDKDGYNLDANTIPTFLKNATAELAFQLILKDRLQTMDDSIGGLKSVTAGSVSVDFDKMDRIQALPQSVLNLIKGFTNNATGGWQIPLVRC